VEEAVRARGLGARVRFVGPVRGVEKSDWFAGAEVLALPSDDENFGVVVVEAAHLGTPVVVSDQVGLAPEVARLGAGRVCRRDAGELAAALEACLDEGRGGFSNGLARLAASFEWAALGERLEAVYRAARLGARA
jgi:glycosyltransferase involved in cell wall biosynthesis